MEESRGGGGGRGGKKGKKDKKQTKNNKGENQGFMLCPPNITKYT